MKIQMLLNYSFPPHRFIDETYKKMNIQTDLVKHKFISHSLFCMVMSRDRNAGWGYSVKIDNSSIERVEQFKYLGMTLADQNSIQEEIKS
jgi:hypothetical protein